jgi:hypothetical protein
VTPNIVKLDVTRLPLLLLVIADTSIARAFEPTTDELGVYRALFSNEKLVVLRDTAVVAELDPGYAAQLAPSHDAFVAEIHKCFPTAEPATIENYSKRRHLLTLLTPRCNIGVKIAILDQETYKQLYPPLGPIMPTKRFRENAWSRFLWHYHGARAVTSITRVGFNTNVSQALVFVQETTGPEIGDSRYTILLDSQNGSWTITKKFLDQQAVQ